MIDITLNGRPHCLPGASTVAELVAEVTGRPLRADGRAMDGGGLGLAVARNSEVVPRSRWVDTAVANGDSVEILGAAQGG
ncbi:sulfur carrier protein ThiS [Microcella alkalica]|uniref:Sulfur carrier protein n=1 Tax=Microcella alkalica TaxID=355930 RepID=A0A839E6M2_9MICO|nr:sulfur carrier protein ThiS [Microcella alkalica]MBA8847440.1 sulfur carrier protein [Microcella alkalica]